MSEASRLGRRATRWQNWSHELEAFPERFFFPRSIGDLQIIVHRARLEGKKIRMAGESHTWSPMVATNDFMVFTRYLKGIDIDKDHPRGPRVTIGPGVTIAELNAALEAQGLVLGTNVPPTSFTQTAACLLGCHGTGIRHHTLPDLVEGIEVVDGHGNIRKFDHRDGEEVLNAARLNLGMFGIIYKMTLKVEPAFNVHEQDDVRVDLRSAPPKFEQFVMDHDYTELVWWPFNKWMWVKNYDRSERQSTVSPCRHDVQSFIQSVLLLSGNLVYGLMTLIPSLTPMLLWVMYRISAHAANAVQPQPWSVHYQAGLNLLRVSNAEVAFPVDKGFANVRHAWTYAVQKTQEYQARGKYPFNVALVARFVRGSSIPISPAHGDGIFCFIEMMSFAGTKHWVEFTTEVMAEWMKIPHSRPHWAKDMRQVPRQDLLAAYGDTLRDFIEIRDRLDLDPMNLFVNDFLSPIFFPQP